MAILANDSQPLKRVGIVVLNYNSSAFVIACIQSLNKYETYPDFEIVVVDNHSPNIGEIEQLKASLPDSVHLVISKVNRGYAAGNNLGLQYLVIERKVDFAFILNGDVVFREPILKKLLDSFAKEPELVAVSPIVGTWGEEENEWAGRIQVRRLLPWGWMMLCNTTFISRLPGVIAKSSAYVYRELMPFKPGLHLVDTINGAAFIIDAKWLQTHNWLNENTFLYYEELILGLDIRKTGGKCGLNTLVSVIHYQGGSTGDHQNKVTRTLFHYSLDSFDYMLKAYYQVSFLLRGIYRVYRKFEFVMKKGILWVRN